MRDIYVLHKSIKEGYDCLSTGTNDGTRFISLMAFVKQYRQLFREIRLRNALISSSIVALSQQLCGSECPRIAWTGIGDQNLP